MHKHKIGDYIHLTTTVRTLIGKITKIEKEKLWGIYISQKEIYEGKYVPSYNKTIRKATEEEILKFKQKIAEHIAEANMISKNEIEEKIEYLEETKEKLENEFDEEEYDEMLNEIYEEVNICGYKYEPSHALKLIDEIAYDTGFNEWQSECITEKEEEIDNEIQDLEDEIQELQEEYEEYLENNPNINITYEQWEKMKLTAGEL